MLSRRVLLKAGAIGASGLAAPAPSGRAAGQGLSWSNGDPFSLGVASGAPSTEGFVIWTRLAPVPLMPDPATPGGMPQKPIRIIAAVRLRAALAGRSPCLPRTASQIG
jgi:alkaline phosphatase D